MYTEEQIRNAGKEGEINYHEVEHIIATLKRLYSDDQQIFVSKCINPNCKYCNGTGEIKVVSETTRIISYFKCFGDGTMTLIPDREEPMNNHIEDKTLK